MLLWTCMPLRVYQNTILTNGLYHCDSAQCEMLKLDSSTKQIQKAYQWIAGKLQKKVGPPLYPNTDYPVWAWYKLRGKRKRPDLRWTEFKNYTEPMILMEIRKPACKILLSDEERWTWGCLNDVPCYLTETDIPETEDYDKISDKEWTTYHQLSKTEQEKYKLQTWNRIFDTKYSAHVQAIFWELHQKEIQKTWIFNKNKDVSI